MARGGLKTPEPGRVTGRVGDGVGESEADGGRRFSTLHCTGMMRSRERGRKRSRVEVRMKSKTRLSGFSREASRHTKSRLVGGGCGLWSVVRRRAASLGGDGLLRRYPRLDALTCICLCQREPVLAAACLN
jgi:hypothetical protein